MSKTKFYSMGLEEAKKHILIKASFALITIAAVFLDFLIISSIFICVWLIHVISNFLNLGNHFVMQVISVVSELGVALIYIIFMIYEIIRMVKLFRYHEHNGDNHE